MKFVRDDYHESQARKYKAIGAFAVAAICILMVLWNVFKGKTPDATMEKDSTALAVPEGERAHPASPGSESVKDLPTLFATIRQSVVMITTYNSSGQRLGVGTGFYITEGGILVSNRHVFGGANRAVVEGTAGKFSISKILEEHSNYDMVRVQVDLKNVKVKPIPISSTPPQIGEKVFVVGNPMGLESSISDGIVSAVRSIEPFGSVIQITSPISPGSSGSPVTNMRGEVVGVATFQMSSGQNLNFAVPIARLKQLNKVDSVNFATINFGNAELVKAQDNPFDQGEILISRKEYESALSYFLEAVKRDPNNAAAFVYLGICYRETKNTNAVAAFKSALDLNQNNAEAYFNLGVTYVQLNQATEAITALREARRLNPNNDEAYMYLGIAYNLNKDYTSSVNILEKAVEIRPDVKAYYYLGFSYNLMGQHEKAIQSLNLCLEMDDQLVEAYLALGLSYAAIEYWDKGIKALNKAVIVAPQNHEVHFILGMLHAGNQDFDSANYEYNILVANRADSKLLNKLSEVINRLKYRR